MANPSITNPTTLKDGAVVRMRGAKGNQTVGDAGYGPAFAIQIPTAFGYNALQVECPKGTVVWSVSANGTVLSAVGYQGFQVQKTITNAQLLALATTPQSLVPQPAAGQAIRVNRCTVEVVVPTTGFTTAYDSFPVYHGATTDLLSGKLSAAQAESAASALFDEGGPVAAGLALTAHAGVDYYTATNWAATGIPDAYLVVTLEYTLVTLI